MRSPFSSEIAFVRLPRVFWPLLGLCLVLSSAIATFLVTRIIPFPGLVYVYSSLAALLAGIPLWWLLILRPKRVTPMRGFLVGILGSTLAHPLMFLIVALFSQVSYLLSSTADISPGTVVVLMILSPIFVGWITVPIGAGTGVLLIYLQLALMQRRLPRTITSEQ